MWDGVVTKNLCVSRLLAKAVLSLEVTTILRVAGPAVMTLLCVRSLLAKAVMSL